MNCGQRQVVYWVLFLAFAVGAIAAGCTKSFDRGDFGYPHQGLAVALGIIAAVFAYIADRDRRDQSP